MYGGITEYTAHSPLILVTRKQTYVCMTGKPLKRPISSGWVFGFQEQMPAPGQTFSSMELTLCGLWTEHTEDVVTRVRWMQV